MTTQNSILIPYTLIRPYHCAWYYKENFAGPGAFWAEVIDDGAIEALQRLYRDKTVAKSIGARGQRDISERQNFAWKADFVYLLLKLLSESKSSTKRSQHVQQLRYAEFLNPVLFRLNAKSLRSKISTFFVA